MEPSRKLTIPHAPKTRIGIPNCKVNIVARLVCDSRRNKLGVIFRDHDGTVGGILSAAAQLTYRMEIEYPESSNIQSRLVATDSHGFPKWAVSANFKHIAEIGTGDARRIYGFIGTSECHR